MTTVQPRTAMTPLTPSDQRTGSPSPATSNGGVQVPAAHIAEQHITEQRERLVLEAEVWKDIDGGPDTFCVTTEDMACEPVSPARFLGMVSDARAQLDRMERLAREFEARDRLAAILAENDLTLTEVDMAEVAAFGPKIAARLSCWAGKEDGRLVVWAPKGQDPLVRVAAIVALVDAPGSVVREG